MVRARVMSPSGTRSRPAAAPTRQVAKVSGGGLRATTPLGAQLLQGAQVDVDAVLALQASYGNRAVQRYLADARVVQRNHHDRVNANDAGAVADEGVGGQPQPRPLPQPPTQVPIGGQGAVGTAGGATAVNLPPPPRQVLAGGQDTTTSPGGTGRVTLPPPPIRGNGQGRLPPPPGPKPATVGSGLPPPPSPLHATLAQLAAIQDIRRHQQLIATATATATTKRGVAQSHVTAGFRHWDTGAADSGLIVAHEAGEAESAARDAIDEGKDRATWLQALGAAHAALTGASRLTQANAAAEIQYAASAQQQLRQLDTQVAVAKAQITMAWAPLRPPPTRAYVVVGLLQQKLNAVRAPGSPRLSVDARFSAETETALKAFQTAASLPVDGVASEPVWRALIARAPIVVRHGDEVVEAQGGARESPPVGGKIHPELKKGSKGAGVREMQQRLNNFVTSNVWFGAAPYKKLRVDGSFGFADRDALKIFQLSNRLTVTGVADKATWVALDAIGAATKGQREFRWEQNAEGMTGIHETARYNWELKGDRMLVTVKIRFTGASDHPRVNQWLQDIIEVWNSYKAVEVGAPQPREYAIEFRPVKSSSGNQVVRVRKPKPGEPDRSNSRNWFVNDTNRGLAPHEFGHLIGLEDEYNRPEEDYVAATGYEPGIGEIRSTPAVSAKDIADEIAAVIATGVTQLPAQRINAIKQKVEQHTLVPGAFARQVEKDYKAHHGFVDPGNPAGGPAPDLASLFGWIAGGGGITPDLSAASVPFLASNSSLMGTMGSVPARGVDLNQVPEHAHPVQARHVRAFANLIAQAFPVTKWEPRKR